MFFFKVEIILLWFLDFILVDFYYWFGYCFVFRVYMENIDLIVIDIIRGIVLFLLFVDKFYI